MRVGLFADCHDHLDNVRLAVAEFNRRECEVVLFAGDLVSTFAVPPLRKLKCRMVGCFGDNEGNRVGLRGGMRVVGRLEEAPVRYQAPDGVRFVIVHMMSQARGLAEPFDVLLYGHTHKPSIRRDDRGRLLINPGETSGWTFGRPTIAVLQTDSMAVELIDLLPSAQPGEPPTTAKCKEVSVARDSVDWRGTPPGHCRSIDRRRSESGYRGRA